MRRTLILAAALALACTAAAPAMAQRGGKSFARTDTNGDGKISLQEFLAARGRMFDRMDANHDGMITKDELAAAGQAAETAAAGRTIRSGRGGGGEAGAGQIMRLQRMAERGPVTRAQWDAMMTKRFQAIDTGNTGYITMAQMRQGRGAGAPPAAGDAMPAPAPMAPLPPKS